MICQAGSGIAHHLVFPSCIPTII